MRGYPRASRTLSSQRTLFAVVGVASRPVAVCVIHRRPTACSPRLWQEKIESHAVPGARSTRRHQGRFRALGLPEDD